jgi:TolA-binding protein
LGSEKTDCGEKEDTLNRKETFMIKKGIPIIFILAGVCLLFWAAFAITGQNTKPQISIDQLRQQALDYIRQDKQIDANSAVKAIISNYTDDAKLSSVLFSVAEAYRNSSKFAKSIELNRVIINSLPLSNESAKAQSGLAVCLAALGKIEESKAELEKLKVNYSNDPCISQLVFAVGDSFYWFGKFSDANNVYKYVRETYPQSDYAMWATMGLALSSISIKDQDSADIYTSELYENYAENKRLSEALYYVAGRYEYGRNYDDANEIYSKIINDWPQEKWAKDSSFESSKINVFKYLDKRDEPNTIKAVDKLINDYNRPDLPAVLLDMAARSDWQNTYKPNSLTIQLYNDVNGHFPKSPQQIAAKLSIDRLNIVTDLDNNVVNVPECIGKFIDDNNGVPKLLEEVYKITEHYQYVGARTQPWFAESKENYINKKLAVCEKIIEKFPDNSNKLNAYKLAADSLRTRDAIKSMGYYQKILDTWPDSDSSGEILFSIGQCYNNMVVLGVLEKDVGVPLIKETFEKVVKNHPNTDYGKLAKDCLQTDPRFGTNPIIPTKQGGK